MLTSIFGIWASEPPRAWRTTEKAGPDRVKLVMLVKLAFVMQRLKNYLKKFCHDQQRWGGTQLL